MQREIGLKPAMVPVADEVLARQASMTQAIILCHSLSGLDDKQICGGKGVVKEPAQWSRIKSGVHHFPQDQFGLLMDTCGNEAPLLWLARSRGYELRPLETKTERELRVERERSAELERENALLRSLVSGPR
ncbi:MAG: hypothetical protein KDH20_15820 [Rhodocyclaceae bacterium]|nr:hypothetical protein [Rhodocyclaceae bacterium]